MKQQKISKTVQVLFLFVIAYLLLYYENDYLWKAQELNIFIDTPLYLQQQMVRPGWLLSWLGSFLTQFFYYPWIGISIMCVWWGILMLLMEKVFRIPANWSLITIIPIAAMLIAIVSLGYWLYFLKMQGYFFAMTIGTTFVLVSMWLLQLIPKNIVAISGYLVAIIAAFYPLIGAYAFLSACLITIVVWRWNDISTLGKVIVSVTLFSAVVIFPILYYYFLYNETNLNNIYRQGLPILMSEGVAEDHLKTYLPYYLLSLSLMVMALMYKRWHMTFFNRLRVCVITQVLLVVLCVCGVCHFWYTDRNFHTELSMQRLLEQQDWEGMLQVAKQNREEPTRAIVMLRNLALFRLSRQGEEMYHYPSGNHPYNTVIPHPMPRMLAHILYFNYGEQNFCFRWCMENGVEMGWRAEYLKYMVRSSLANGEVALAKKYLHLLARTNFHREWASHYEIFTTKMHNISKDKEFNPVMHLGNREDVVANDYGRIELFLMHQFSYFQSPDTLFKEQALLSAMWTKEAGLFWPCFFNYAKSHAGKPMPTHYQEAALLFGQQSDVDISRMPFDEKVVSDFQHFIQMLHEYDGINLAQMRQLMYPHFGNTYYYECYFAPSYE